MILTSLRRSLKGRIALGSGGLFFLLYTVACALILVIDARNLRSQLEVQLYAQSESLASYYASSHRLDDYPELLISEKDTPYPVWLRVIRNGRVLAATPGLPGNLPVQSQPRGEYGKLRLWRPEAAPGYAVVAHEVWNEPGTEVEAFSPLSLLAEREKDLASALFLSGLLLFPLAALAGSFLAARALQPVDTLITSIRSLDSDRLEERLATPGAVTEITGLTEEFNRLLDRLEENVEAMRRFTADASHELRTPISILRTSLEVTLRRDRTPEEYRELLRENLGEIRRVQRIVEALLTLARVRRGGSGETQRTVLDLSALLEGTLAAIRTVAQERGIRLETTIPPHVQVLGDEDQLGLLALNLLDNAVKFTPTGQAVHVALEDGPDQVRLEVRDEGPGVALQDRPFIFDRFYRGQAARSTGSSTGGLGLSVVRWVAESHGGEARLLDEPGPGAVFEVTLPRLPEVGG